MGNAFANSQSQQLSKDELTVHMKYAVGETSYSDLWEQIVEQV